MKDTSDCMKNTLNKNYIIYLLNIFIFIFIE